MNDWSKVSIIRYLVIYTEVPKYIHLFAHTHQFFDSTGPTLLALKQNVVPSIIECEMDLPDFFLIHKRGVEKAKKTCSDIALCACVIAVQRERWMCLGIQRHTHITPCNLVTI